MAQTAKGYLDMRHITGLSGGDLESDTSVGRGFAPGQPTWMHDSYGMRLFTYIQNRNTGGAYTRGMVVSRVGDNNGLTVVTASTGTTISVSHGTAALVTDQHVGAIALIGGLSASTAATEGESSIVKSNSSSAVNVDPLLPFSAAPVASQEVQLIGTYNTQIAASADANHVAVGVVVPQGGISTGNFGFVQSIGICPRVEKDTGTTNAIFTTRSAISISSGSGQCYQATTGTNSSLVIGRALGPAASGQTQAAVILNMQHIIPWGGTGAVV